LAELDLDWDAPSYPPAPQDAEATPLAIDVDTGMLVPDESPRQAIIRYSLALAVMPINPTAYLRRGHAYYQLGQWCQAADDLSLAFALDPGNKDSQAWSELGIACHQSFRRKEAVEAYSRLLQLEGEEASVYNQRSVAYYSLDLWDKAIADLERALKLQADFPMAKNNLAWMLATCPEPRLRNPTRAVELAKQAVASLPKEGTFRTTLGIAQYRAGDWAAARNALQEALGMGGGTANPFGFGRTTLFLAMSHWQRGEQEKARAFYQQAVEWIDKNQPTLENDAGRWNELGRFRAEAEATLAQPPGQAKK
jgi:tetratricopeptide (TPR) repeat protein